MNVQCAELPFEGRTVRLEYAWLDTAEREAPLVVFLHEGLGTLAMWRDFPQRLCDAGGFRELLYSRYGYGRSTTRPPREPWPPDYLEREARRALPNFLHAVGNHARRNGVPGGQSRDRRRHLRPHAEVNAAQGGEPAPQILRAIENLRFALRLKLARGGLSDEQVRDITAILDDTARKIEQS